MTENAQPLLGRPKESFLSIWSRRALSVPTYVALASLYFVVAPVWLLAATAADIVDRRGRTWPRTRALGFFGLYVMRYELISDIVDEDLPNVAWAKLEVSG